MPCAPLKKRLSSFLLGPPRSDRCECPVRLVHQPSVLCITFVSLWFAAEKASRKFMIGAAIQNVHSHALPSTSLQRDSMSLNLSLYTVSAFLILDAEGHRVLAKYYRPKSHPNADANKSLTTLKEQRAFEKGLWGKTKKPGGTSCVFSDLTPTEQLRVLVLM